MKFSVAIILVALLCGFVSAYESYKPCGRILSKILDRICWSAGKAKHDIEWYLPREGAEVFGAMRGKRSLVFECCYKGCTIEDLLTHC